MSIVSSYIIQFESMHRQPLFHIHLIFLKIIGELYFPSQKLIYVQSHLKLNSTREISLTQQHILYAHMICFFSSRIEQIKKHRLRMIIRSVLCTVKIQECYNGERCQILKTRRRVHRIETYGQSRGLYVQRNLLQL